MIVGASVLQLPAIIKAKEMGSYVGVVDYNPKAIGIAYADEYYNESTMDENAVLKAAEKFKPDGIMTLATDMPMRGVAKASQQLGLHSISYDTAVKATDKFEMIKAFKEYGVSSPWYYLIGNKNDLYSLKEKLEYPCIIKPTDNAGSHGVAKINSFEELLEQYEYSRSNSRHGNVIIEEFLNGPEVSVEIMVVDNVVNVLQITDKLTTGAPYFVEMGHSQPTQFSPQVKEQIIQVAQKACEAVGINVGPAHVEMKITNRGPVMVELGARMGGDNITTHLVPLSTGVDMVEATIEAALGIKPDVTIKKSYGSAIRYFDVPCGIIKSIRGINEAQLLPGVVQITFTKEVGENANNIQCSNDRIGFVIAQAETSEKAVEICEKAMRIIKIEIQ